MSRFGFQNAPSFSAISKIDHEHELIDSSFGNEDSRYYIKINGPSQFGHMTTEGREKIEQPVEQQIRAAGKVNAINLRTTGHEASRDLYSEEEIRQAFHMIDLNKDGVLSFEDLDFFLKCMNESHTQQEVREMIRMVSSQGDKVGLEDFRKIGQGVIIPFAGMRVPDQRIKEKQQLMKNLKETKLVNFDPEEILESDASELSYEHFQQEINRRGETREDQGERNGGEDSLNGVLRLRGQAQMRKRREELQRADIVNVTEVVRSAKALGHRLLESKQVGQLLGIDQGKARVLFMGGQKHVPLTTVLMEVVLFGKAPPLSKFQLILLNFNRQQRINFSQWYHILQFIIGTNKRDTIRKKLQYLLRHRGLNTQTSYDKYFVLEFMGEEREHFPWISKE